MSTSTKSKTMDMADRKQFFADADSLPLRLGNATIYSADGTQSLLAAPDLFKSGNHGYSINGQRATVRLNGRFYPCFVRFYMVLSPPRNGDGE